MVVRQKGDRVLMEGYSDRFVQMASNTERYGVLEKPDGYGTRTGDCGDKVEFYLSARGGQVRMLTFQISGCLNTFACANTVSYMVEGPSISDCWRYFQIPMLRHGLSLLIVWRPLNQTL